MEPGTIIGIVIGIVCLAIAVYFGFRGDVQEKRAAKERKEIKDLIASLSKKIEGADIYIDGLPEMTEKKRRAKLRSGLKLMRDYKYGEAIDFFKECLESVAIQSEKVSLLILIGNCYSAISTLNEAEKHYKEAEIIAVESSDREGEASVLGNMGNVHQEKGELDKALEHYEKAMKIHKEIGDRKGEAKDMNHMGITYRIIGKFDTAMLYLQLALKINREIKNRDGEASVLNNMGSVYREKGESEKALEHYQLALKINKDIGDRIGEAHALGNIGSMHYINGELDKAIESYQLALKIFEEIGARKDIEKTRQFLNKLGQNKNNGE